MSYYSYLCTAIFKIGFLFLYCSFTLQARAFYPPMGGGNVWRTRHLWDSEHLDLVFVSGQYSLMLLLFLKLNNLMLQELTTGVIGVVGGQVSWSEGSISSQYEAKHLRCMIGQRDLLSLEEWAEKLVKQKREYFSLWEDIINVIFWLLLCHIPFFFFCL